MSKKYLGKRALIKMLREEFAVIADIPSTSINYGNYRGDEWVEVIIFAALSDARVRYSLHSYKWGKTLHATIEVETKPNTWRVDYSKWIREEGNTVYARGEDGHMRVSGVSMMDDIAAAPTTTTADCNASEVPPAGPSESPSGERTGSGGAHSVVSSVFSWKTLRDYGDAATKGKTTAAEREDT